VQIAEQRKLEIEPSPGGIRYRTRPVGKLAAAIDRYSDSVTELLPGIP